MLATLIPLFDDKISVHSYSIFAQKDNFLLNPHYLGSGQFDGAANVTGLDLVDSMGIDSLSGNKEVFVEINQISLFADIDSQSHAPHSKLVLLIDPSVTPEAANVDRISQLKSKAYKFAIRKLPIEKFVDYNPILLLMDYILLDHKKINIVKAKIFFSRFFPLIQLCAVNVNSKEDYDKLTADGGYDLYEGTFFRMPVTKSEKNIAPLKINYLELLNAVNGEDFDLTKAADVIGRDTALVISLLKMVNNMSVNSGITSVRHAAAMLGQKELKRWINTAVTRELCADRPSEIMRLSMLRARFAENLAPLFEMANLSAELFLMGLFSVLDIMIEKPMSEALEMVKVSKNIQQALIDKSGPLYCVMNFILQYENAYWQEVSRQLIVYNIDLDDLYKAYVGSLEWYRDLFK